MWYRLLAIAAACSACGTVHNEPTNQPTDAAADAPADGPMALTYHAAVPQSSTVPFGGAPECSYTVTLRQTDIQLAILPSGKVTGGQVQTLYDEKITGTCGHPPASPTISNYTFASATTTAGGMTLMFQEKPGDKPGASLTIGLTAAGANYQAQLTFHRTDLSGTLAWTVTLSATLIPQ
ncbi:MAG TPA: hypothetical protein VHT91_26560 [Kofleriaceae bacterium]|jgi:hypothetical protein|nr:hypothetical protein [Kofleriaceae bacterium]